MTYVHLHTGTATVCRSDFAYPLRTDNHISRRCGAMAIGGATASSREALLSKKIRTQASQLAQLNETLQQEGSYSRLLERRLLELDPEHPLPVTPQHLGRGGGGSSQLQQQKTPAAGGGCGRRNDHEGGDDMSSMRRGYAAAQERLKDAAQLIRTLREALASR